MNVDYGYLLLTGFVNSYFSITAFPKCERYRVLRTLEGFQEAGSVSISVDNDQVITLTAKGAADYQDLLDGKAVSTPDIPVYEDCATRRRAEIILAIRSLTISDYLQIAFKTIYTTGYDTDGSNF